MKFKEMNKLSDKELIKMKKELEFAQVKASSLWGMGKIKDKEAGIISRKGVAKKGDKTSLQKQIRKNIARINTIINERRLKTKNAKFKRNSKQIRTKANSKHS